MTKRRKKEPNVLMGEHPNCPGQPDIIGHYRLKRMKMGVHVRGKSIIQFLKKRLEKSKVELGLVDDHKSSGERRF